MKVFQDIKPSETRKTLLNYKGENYFVPERGACIILFPVQIPRIILSIDFKERKANGFVEVFKTTVLS